MSHVKKIVKNILNLTHATDIRHKLYFLFLKNHHKLAMSTYEEFHLLLAVLPLRIWIPTPQGVPVQAWVGVRKRGATIQGHRGGKFRRRSKKVCAFFNLRSPMFMFDEQSA